jgi:hypothetical protein
LATDGGRSQLVSSITAREIGAVRSEAGPFNADVPVITDRGYTLSLAGTWGKYGWSA